MRDAHEHVPGCTGGEQDATSSDYCIRLEDFPDNAGTLSPSSRPSVAPSHAPSSIPSSHPTYPWGDLTVLPEPVSRPLGACEGDCDKDEDCEEGLICFMRDSYQEPVPGCNGPRDGSRTDYCVYENAGIAGPQPSAHPSSHPSSLPSHLPSSHPSGAPSPLPSSHPSGAPSPLPSSHPSSQPSSLPSSHPSSKPSATPSHLPSSHPSGAPSPAPFDSGNVLIPIVDHGATPPSSKIPMILCEGDCDSDADCAPGLVCKQRDPGDDVPGCTGDFSSASDFCVKSDKKAPLIDYGDTPPANFKPLRFCEGDCDTDADCGNGMICKQRNPGDDIPGCEGDFSSASDFCVWP